MDPELLTFLPKQRFVGFELPSSPHFDSDEATTWFITKLKGSEKYLECGTGGSTYLAAKLGVNFIAVDSDPYFLNSLRKKIVRDGFAKAIALFLLSTGSRLNLTPPNAATPREPVQCQLGRQSGARFWRKNRLCGDSEIRSSPPSQPLIV